MKKILSSLFLSGIVVSSMLADIELTLIDKDGNQTSQCVKSYSFSNNLESIARQSGDFIENITTNETMTNRRYKGKPLYTKIINIPIDASSLSNVDSTKSVEVLQEVHPDIDRLFIKDSRIKFGPSYYDTQLIEHFTATYVYVRGLNNKVQFRTYHKIVESAEVVVEYTKVNDSVITNDIEVKSYLHYISSSSTTNELVNVDLKDMAFRLSDDYTYDSNTDSCTAN